MRREPTTTVQLEISASPRTTRFWARTPREADRVHHILDAADQTTPDRTTGRVLEVDPGESTLNALRTLDKAGYIFRWHPSQSRLHQAETKFGFSIAAPNH